MIDYDSIDGGLGIATSFFYRVVYASTGCVLVFIDESKIDNYYALHAMKTTERVIPKSLEPIGRIRRRFNASLLSDPDDPVRGGY